MLEKIKSCILKSNKIAIFNHKNPDGDAMGSAFALKLALRSIGKHAEVFLREGDCCRPEYSYIISGTDCELTAGECDLKIAVDSADFQRISDFAEYFTGETVALDHHVTHKPYAKYTYVLPDASSAGEVVYRLLRYMNIEITAAVAHNLYVAIASDTGSFKYSSTTPETHIIAAELISCGADVGQISKEIFDTKDFAYFKMLRTAIDKVELCADGKIAVLCLAKSDFEENDASEDTAGGIVTIPGKIKGVEVSVYIRERDGEYKVSLRSSSSHFDVAKTALFFGGGGHVRAAGFSLDAKSLDEAKKIVLNKLIET